MRHTTAATLVACLTALVTNSVLASDWTGEYDKKIKTAQNVGVLGNDLAGDRVNYYTGATTFYATDVSVPATGMGIAVSRSYAVESGRSLASVKVPLVPGDSFSGRLRSFGDWDLDVPRITAEMSQDDGWIIDTTTPTKRCEVVGKMRGSAPTWAATGAPAVVQGTRGWNFTADKYWNGYMLHVDGAEQSMLAATLTNPQRPSTGGPYEWTTNQNWWISCIPTLNESAGQGFLARSPDGKTYTFNWISRQNMTSVSYYEDEIMTQHSPVYLYRAEYQMLPTRIEDRFGNWINYVWSNDSYAQLDRIETGLRGSTTPEATIKVFYSAQGLISSITDGSRTWTYEYTAHTENSPANTPYTYYSLSRVVLPGSNGAWQYSFGDFEASVPSCAADWADPSQPDYYLICWAGGDIDPAGAAYTVTHPSGAKVEFLFGQHYQYDSGVPWTYPMGLEFKTISGPGLTASTWSVNYWPTKEEAKSLTMANTPPTVNYTDVVNPDRSITRHVFGGPMKIGDVQGSVVAASGGGSPAITSTSNSWVNGAMDDVNVATGIVPTWYRSNVITYVASGSQSAYVERVGVNPQGAFGSYSQVYSSERRLPELTRSMVQQGVTFTTQTSSFDAYARPLTVTRSSSGGAGGNFTRTEATTYYDNASRWVLGQVASTTVGTKVVSETEFNAADQPWKLYKPRLTSQGKLLKQTLAYNANGTLASVTDGNGKVTTLGNWYMGVPRAIGYPTSFSTSATVGTDGTIQSTTDELGNVTQYGYDPMGWLKSVKYPTGGSTTWTDLTRSLSFVAGAEYGLPANHWKQVVDSPVSTAGGAPIARTTTLYDARFNPVLTLTEDTTLSSSKSFVVRRFDGMGRETFRSYPVASANVNDALTGFVTEYDALGRVTKVKQDSELGALATQTEYLTGFQTRVTNPRGFATTTNYQVFDSPSTDAPVRIDAPQGVSTVITRDGFGKPLQITRSGPGG